MDIVQIKITCPLTHTLRSASCSKYLGGKMSKKELSKLQDCLDSAMTLVGKYQKLIDPLLDPNFRGLSCPEIAELAKKSIRLTAENRRLEEALEEYCNKQISFTGELPFKTTESDILDIINKAKGQK